MSRRGMLAALSSIDLKRRGNSLPASDTGAVVPQARPINDWALIAPSSASAGRCGRPRVTNHTGQVAALDIAAERVPR
jgi:hypothetical protein